MNFNWFEKNYFLLMSRLFLQVFLRYLVIVGVGGGIGFQLAFICIIWGVL